jgi:hypothetical protein
MDGALSMESAEAAKEESAVDSPDPSLSLCDHNKKSILYASKASDVRCFRLQSKKITEDFILHIGNIGIPSAKLFRELDIILARQLHAEITRHTILEALSLSLVIDLPLTQL